MKTRLFGLLAALGLFTLLALPAAAQDTNIPVSIGNVSLSKNGQTATVNFTFTCAITSDYYASAQVFQTSGRLLNGGGNSVYGNCTAGEVVSVSVPVTSQFSSAFKNGPASVSVGASQYDYNAGNYYSGQTTQTVRLSPR